MTRFKNWLIKRFSEEEEILPDDLRRTGTHARPHGLPPKKAKPRPKPAKSKPPQQNVETGSAGSIESRGPGKNVLIRTKYVREETATHETLKILDDSLIESGEEPGIDPYNTGGFDRSKNWAKRFRK